MTMKGDKTKDLEQFLIKLIQILPPKDQQTCRLLNHKWKTRVDENVVFQMTFSDLVLQTSRSPSSSLRSSVLVQDLWGPVTKQHHKFLASIRQLTLERSFSDDDVPTERPSPTIAFDNIVTFLYQAFNVESLTFNPGSLNHPEFLKYTFVNVSLALPRLKKICVTVTGTEELDTLSRMFGQFFPNLESLGVIYREIKWSETFENYLDVLLFILKHKATIKTVSLEDPPMVPRIRAQVDHVGTDILMTPFVWKLEGNDDKDMDGPREMSTPSGEPISLSLAASYGSYMKLFRDQFTQLRLEKINVGFSMNKFSCWGVGMEMLQSQSNLVEIVLERVPAILAQQLAWENAPTLKKLLVIGIKKDVLPQVSKEFDGWSLKLCDQLIELVLQDFSEILHIDWIPMRNLRTLALVTYSSRGKNSSSNPLCSYETAVKLCDSLVCASKITLSRSSMITCQLYRRLRQLPNLKQLMLIGFRSQTFSKEDTTSCSRDFVREWLKQKLSGVLSDPMPKLSGAPLGSEGTSPYVQNPQSTCSEVSLCSSCVKIMFPNASMSKSLWGSLPKNVRRSILSWLPREDLCSARLVSRQFCTDAQKSLLFGFYLSDSTKDFVCDTSLRRIEYLVVGNLRNCVPPEKLYFARFVRTLVLEFNESTLLSDGESWGKVDEGCEEVYPRDDVTIERAFGCGKEPSIHARNIVGLLGACYNLRALFFNQWALSNFLGSSRVSIKSKVFQNLVYRNLRSLHFMIHSSEVDAMIQFLALDFNSKVIELDKLSIEIVGTPKAKSSIEIYDSIFKFIGNHDTLSELRLVDQVFSSDYNSKSRNDIEPTLSMAADKCRCCCVKILTSIHLQKLTVIFKESSSKWNLGFVFLRAQRYLTDVWLEGLPLNEVHTVILNSAETLLSIYVSGVPYCKKRSVFNFSYTKNCHRLRRLTVRNVDVENSQDVPESVQILEINTVPSKNILWNISPSLNRIRGRATMSQKVVRNFFRKFQNMEKIALINLGCLGMELLRLFLQLSYLNSIVVSEISDEARKELEGLAGITLEQITLAAPQINTLNSCNNAGGGGGVASKTPSKQQLATQLIDSPCLRILIDRSVFSEDSYFSSTN